MSDLTIPPPWRCSKCGFNKVRPGPLAYGDEDRYALGTCNFCRSKRPLIRAETPEEATKGYRATLAAKQAALNAKRQIAGANQAGKRTEP